MKLVLFACLLIVAGVSAFPQDLDPQDVDPQDVDVAVGEYYSSVGMRILYTLIN